MTYVDFPEQTPEQAAAGERFWRLWARAERLANQHAADQFRAGLHRAVEVAQGIDRQCVCGAPDCRWRDS